MHLRKRPDKRGDGRTTNIQHLFWPNSAYRTKLERQFVEQECAKVVIDIRAHRLLNKIFPRGIPKPSQEDIEMFVAWHENKECSCYEPKGAR